MRRSTPCATGCTGPKLISKLLCALASILKSLFPPSAKEASGNLVLLPAPPGVRRDASAAPPFGGHCGAATLKGPRRKSARSERSGFDGPFRTGAQSAFPLRSDPCARPASQHNCECEDMFDFGTPAAVKSESPAGLRRNSPPADQDRETAAPSCCPWPRVRSSQASARRERSEARKVHLRLFESSHS